MDTMDRFKFIPIRCFIEYGDAPLIYACTPNTLDGLMSVALMKRIFKNKLTVEVFKTSRIQPMTYGRIHEFKRSYLLGMTYYDEEEFKEEIKGANVITINQEKTKSITRQVYEYLKKLTDLHDHSKLIGEVDNFVFHKYNNSHLAPKVLDELRDILGAKLFFQRFVSDFSMALSDSERGLLALYKNRLDDYIYEHINNCSLVEIKLDKDDPSIIVLIGLAEYYQDDIAETRFNDDRYNSPFDILILFDTLHTKTYLYSSGSPKFGDWSFDDLNKLKTKLSDLGDSDKQYFIEHMLNERDIEVKFMLG